MMAKPVGARCNLACSYCYYLDKDELKSPQASSQMSEELLETFVQQYIEAQAVPEVQFIWHGGEPMLRGLEFFKKALRLQRKYAGGRRISNVLQTNGTLLTDEWCRFLREHHFLVGISIDGPAGFHDTYRQNRHGMSSHGRVMRGIRLLERHGVDWNAMSTVNAANVDHPREFYHFFRDLSCQYLQFTPVTPEPSNGLFSEERSSRREWINASQWGEFLCTVFDEWVRCDVGHIFVQLFDATLANWAGVAPGICSMGTNCGGAASLETDGSVYACDHFTTPSHRLGNIGHQTITEILWSAKAQAFARQKTELLSRQCRECAFLFACHGECPRNRFVNDGYGSPHHNYLCEGYLSFFRHVAPAMDFMVNELRHQRPPANIMRVYG